MLGDLIGQLVSDLLGDAFVRRFGNRRWYKPVVLTLCVLIVAALVLVLALVPA